MHSVTDRQTDGRTDGRTDGQTDEQDDANSRSYCVAVRSAKNRILFLKGTGLRLLLNKVAHSRTTTRRRTRWVAIWGQYLIQKIIFNVRRVYNLKRQSEIKRIGKLWGPRSCSNDDVASLVNRLGCRHRDNVAIRYNTMYWLVVTQHSAILHQLTLNACMPTTRVAGQIPGTPCRKM